MTKAKVTLNMTLNPSERFRMKLLVLQVDCSDKFPEGVKARYVLIDMIKKIPRLLVDNHAPYGFHAHTELPENKSKREKLQVRDYKEALIEFKRLAMEIMNREA